MLGKYYIGEFAVSSWRLGGGAAVGAAAASGGGCRQLAAGRGVPPDVNLCADPTGLWRVLWTRNLCLTRAAAAFSGRVPSVYLQGGAPVKAAKPVRAAATGAVASSSTLTSLIRALLPILLVLAAIWYMQNMQGKTA